MRSLFAVAFAVSFVVSAQAQLTAHLEIKPETTLPGIPSTIRITVRNDSAQAVRLPDYLSLVATTTSGTKFTVLFYGGSASAPISDLGDVRDIAPHSTDVLENATTGSAVTPGWFDDPRLNEVSRLQLQAFLGSRTDAGTTADVASNTVVLQIQEPLGVDASVWKAMMAVHGDRWQSGFQFLPSGRQLAVRVVAQLPYSTYAGWFATAGVSGDFSVSADALRAWLAQAPADEFTEWRQLRLAVFEEDAARYYGSIRPEETAAHLRRARADYDRLLKSTNSKIASKARQLIDGLRDTEPEP